MIAMLAVGLFVSAANAQVSEDMIRLVGKREVTQDDLQGYSAADLRILRNSIYAVHGRIFKSDDLKNYFSRFSWYKPKFANVDSKLTPVEKKNVATIKALEDAGGVPQGGGAQGGTFKDPRDGKIYRVAKIGNQTWMAQNLNYDYKKGKNGVFCPDDNCDKYGRAYSWDIAKKVCPAGWRLPSEAEFEKLIRAAGGEKIAGKALKSKYGWMGANGTDAFGFAGVPAGMYRLSGDDYEVLNGSCFQDQSAFFWSSTVDYRGQALYMELDASDDGAGMAGLVEKFDALSVRCVKD